MARGVNVSFIGGIPEFDPAGDGISTDYRPVPASDDGRGYDDRGMLGSYRPPDDAFRTPDGVSFATGFGADRADVERGFVMPSIRDDPAYIADNYKDRSTRPRLSDADEDGSAMADDYAFRRRNERARGFLTRPHLPTER